MAEYQAALFRMPSDLLCYLFYWLLSVLLLLMRDPDRFSKNTGLFTYPYVEPPKWTRLILSRLRDLNLAVSLSTARSLSLRLISWSTFFQSEIITISFKRRMFVSNKLMLFLLKFIPFLKDNECCRQKYRTTSSPTVLRGLPPPCLMSRRKNPREYAKAKGGMSRHKKNGITGNPVTCHLFELNKGGYMPPLKL